MRRTLHMGAVDAKLLAQLLGRHGPALELFARQWCRAPADVVQQALLQLSRQRTVPDPLLPWLYRVVRNGAISVGRAERRRDQHEAAAARQGQTWFEPSPDSRLDADVAAEALATLPIDEREAIVAHLWGGLTFEQIAEVSGSTSSTVHRRYHAGLVKLRMILGVPCPNAKSKLQT